MKENQRITVTKRMLQEGLLRLLKTEPIDKVNVSELCQESGINRATFYRHYTCPRDVLLEIRKGIFQEIRGLTREDAGDLRESLEAICRYCYDRREVLRLLFANQTDGGFAELLKELYQEQIAQQPGPRQITGEADRKLASYYYAGGFFFLLRQWLTEEIEKTPSEVAGLIYQFVSGRAE